MTSGSQEVRLRSPEEILYLPFQINPYQMTKVLLFGATGQLGKKIAAELKSQGYKTTAVVRNTSKAGLLPDIHPVIADITNAGALKNICNGYEVVISALGKSVSINDSSKPSFYDIDYCANAAILSEAKKSGVRKFIYVSAFHAEQYPKLQYFKVHHDFSELLKSSGIPYCIVKPVALFSAFIDLVDLAKKGRLTNIGSGEFITNPIYEGDLAIICTNAIKENTPVVEVGGPTNYRRKQLLEIIQQQAAPGKKIRNMPIGAVKLLLPIIKLFNKNMYDKFAFFTEVVQHDLLAPAAGKLTFEEYMRGFNDTIRDLDI